jgi:hypothetical protein
MASFSWDSAAAFSLEIKEEIIFRPGINLITGPTGTGNIIFIQRRIANIHCCFIGKTSMLLALLGKEHRVPEEVFIDPH